MSYRISTVSEMTGIPRNTLIAWERRFGLLNPRRQNNGYRRYSEDDVGQLLRLKNALNTGLKISEAVALLRQQAGKVTEDLSPREKPTAEDSNSFGCPFAALCSDFLEAIYAYRGDQAQSVLSRTLTIPFETRLKQIYFPLLRQIRALGESGKLTIAQDRYAMGILKGHLATLFINSQQASLSSPHAACATMPHDEQEVPALALGIQLSMTGQRVSYLGPKLPVDALTDFCVKQKPLLVCISCITRPKNYTLESYIQKLAPVAESGVRVVLGGETLAGFVAQAPVEVIPNWSNFSLH